MGIIIPDMGITDYERKLSSYLFNKTRRSLLALLFGRPDESFYVNQIVQRLGSGSGAVQRELKMMTEAEIVVRERRGNLVYYRANSNSPIFDELKNIVRKTFGVADIIRESLAPILKRIKVAFIYGSVARSAEGDHPADGGDRQPDSRVAGGVEYISLSGLFSIENLL